MINKVTLNGDYELYTIWQESKDGVPEQAINVRGYDHGIFEIKQGKSEVLVNREALPELIKVLRYYHLKC